MNLELPGDPATRRHKNYKKEDYEKMDLERKEVEEIKMECGRSLLETKMKLKLCFG